jgi:hypothetical protein
MTVRLRTRASTLLLIVGLVASACGGSSSPGASSAAPSGVPATDAAPTTPAGAIPVGVGPIAIDPLALDAADDPRLALARLEADEIARMRIQAGFAIEVGSGWGRAVVVGR